MIGAAVAVAAEQDLVVGPIAMPCGAGQAGEWDDEGRLDLHRYGVDHRHAAGSGWLAVDFRDGDVELAGAMVPLALLSAVVGFWRTICSVERNFFTTV